MRRGLHRRALNSQLSLSLAPHHPHRRREDAPTPAFEMWMLLEQTPMHWDALFRFTVPEFFFDLLPALHLPQYFRVDG